MLVHWLTTITLPHSGQVSRGGRARQYVSALADVVCYAAMDSTELLTYTAARYVQPLREGGSLPAIVDTDGGGLFVVKFRGAGQGARALVAELVVGLLADRLGLPVPEIALVEIPAEFGRS